MKEENEKGTPANAAAESKLGKRARMIFVIVFGLGFLFLIFKMAMKRFG